MKLYVIGNGFDIAHGLKTDYWSFRSFIEQVDPHFLELFEIHYNIYQGVPDKEKKRLLWNEFEKNLANIDEDIIIESAMSVEMDLESGDVGIEDTLYRYFSEEFQYIEKLKVYLKRCIRTIKIRDVQPRVSVIDNYNHDIFVNFNYTATLENVYVISNSSVIHIHGSLRDYTQDPILGHGNRNKIEEIEKKKKDAEKYFDEKEISICKVIEDYYKTTLKDINRYMPLLYRIKGEQISDIIVAGHSLAGIDMPYFRCIDSLTNNCLIWKVVYYDETRSETMKNSLIEAGINKERIIMISAEEFYDLS